MKRKATRETVVQIYDGVWYLDKFDQHECCDCGAQHDVEYGVERGRLFTKWTMDRRATARNRRRDGITVKRTPPPTRGQHGRKSRQ